MKKIINKSVFLVNILTGLTLLLAYVSPYVEPDQFWWISMFGLAFPFLLIANILFCIYWLFRWKKYFFFSLIVVSIASIHLKSFYQSNKQESYPPIESFKVISHNLRAFGLNGPQFQTDDGNKIFKFLDQEVYDIYCFQEFFNTNRPTFTPYDSIKKYTGAKYRHVEYLVEFRGNKFGIATLSQHPIIEKGIVPFDREGTNMCIYSDIDFNGKIVRVYNMHLQSLGFRKKDYAFLKHVGDSNDATIAGAKNIVSRLRSAFVKRQEQAKIIRKHIEACPFPVVVCGDFNDTPLSYSYEEIKGPMKDAFVENGQGFGSTYNGAFPLLRIDYIFYSPELQNQYFQRVKENLSDHYPLVAYFTFEE